jgi:serine/threonine protein kinase
MTGLLHSRYRVKHMIGSGGFGTIFRAEAVSSSTEVAIKIQADPARPSVILNECSVYGYLSGAPGFPSIHEVGCDNDRHFFVMDLLGNSLRQLFRGANHRFSLRTVLMLIDQMIARVEYLHSKGFVHRDLKPSNFAIGLNSHSNQVYLIDFGLAARCPTAETPGPHVFAGTPCYASIAAQSGREASRRDDLESLGYIFVYLATGGLPWRKLPVDKAAVFNAILTTKAGTPISKLCAGLPPQFAAYIEAVRGLGFAEEPDYAGYRRMFRDLFIERGFVYDHRYDWVAVRKQFSFGLESRITLATPKSAAQPRANSFQRGVASATGRVVAVKRKDPREGPPPVTGTRRCSLEKGRPGPPR